MPPTDEQVEAVSRASHVFGPVGPGHFKPSSNYPAQVDYPHVLRLRYPRLAIATIAFIHVWDVREGMLVQTIDISTKSGLSDSQGPRCLQHVEFIDGFIVASSKTEIVVFSLEDGTCVQSIPMNQVLLDLPGLKLVAPATPQPEDFKACLAPLELEHADRYSIAQHSVISGDYIPSIPSELH